jgi:DNA polymerase III alpha subunit
MAFAELSITSNFTFLTGGSHPQEYARRAAELGLPAFAIADRNSVAGVVRAHAELRTIARETGAAPRLLPAARLVLTDGAELTALPRDRAAWGRLCRVLSRGALRAEKGQSRLEAADLGDLAGVRLLLHPPQGRGRAGWRAEARGLAGALPDLHLLAVPRYDGQDRARLDRLARLATDLGLDLVASAAPIMHHGSRRRLVDVLTCIREGLRSTRSAARALRQCRAAAAPRGRDAAALRAHEDAVHRRRRDRRALHLLARRAALRISRRDRWGETPPQAGSRG